MVADKTVLFYKPTPKDCAACHGSNVPVAGSKKSGL
jgi:mono/diheme cytochrome c family protein